MADDLAIANQEALEYLFEELSALGVEEFCIAAGARNAPIISGLYHERSQASKCYHFFDERSAGFFALGRSLATQKPVAVVTTSGTAVAELLPATIEAYYQSVPLVLISADRPSSYRGSGAPQAIEQKHLFEPYLGIRRDVEFRKGALHVERRDFRSTGSFPYHFNVCLEERVVPEVAYLRSSTSGPDSFDASTAVEAWNAFLPDHPSARWAVLISGIPPKLAPFVEAFLLRFNVPFLAEETANLSASMLRSPLRLNGGEAALKCFGPTHLLRLGAVPSWRYWRDLENSDAVKVFNFATGAFSGLARQSQVHTHSMLSAESWEKLRVPTGSREINALSHVDAKACALSLMQRFPKAEPSLLLRLALLLPENDALFLGNSLTIRYWNQLCVAMGKPRHSFANRGANGIDGLISTWLGLGAEAPHSTMILGDLSALYDLNAPWILPQLRQDASRHLVIVNNGGGKIFSGLPWLKQVPASTQIAFENTHQLRFEAWAAMWNAPYQRISTTDELTSINPKGFRITELLPDPEHTQAFWDVWHQLLQVAHES